MKTVFPGKPLSTSKEARSFRRAAEAYVRKATVSQKTADRALRELGLYDAKGKLTKPYR